MGLDMYLNRVPRKNGVTMQQINAANSYFDWLDAKERGSEYANCTFEEWCGLNESELPSQEVMDFYKPYYVHRYSYWDVDHKCGYKTIFEQVGYWRKANQIHKWFVNHCQNGEDDCCYHDECTKDILEELLDTCRKVLGSCKLVQGKVQNGYVSQNGKMVPSYEDGKTIENPSVANELLPSQSGFFFGGTNYDEWYLRDIKETIKILEEVLSTTDFDNQMIYYVSSW